MSSQPASALARWLWRLAFILVTVALVIFFSKGACIYPVDAAQFSHPLLGFIDIIGAATVRLKAMKAYLFAM